MVFWSPEFRHTPADLEACLLWVAETRTVIRVAGLLAVARTGKDLTDSAVDELSLALAALAQEHYLTPDDMARALSFQEPDLGRDWGHQTPELNA